VPDLIGDVDVRAAQPPWLMVLAVEYSGRKFHGVPLQSAIRCS
jgi:hypothetical protein